MLFTRIKGHFYDYKPALMHDMAMAAYIVEPSIKHFDKMISGEMMDALERIFGKPFHASRDGLSGSAAQEILTRVGKIIS